MITTILGWGAKALGLLSPISDVLKGWKQELFIAIAYWRGKKAGEKKEQNASTKKALDDVDQVKRDRNDPDRREWVREKYWRDE